MSSMPATISLIGMVNCRSRRVNDRTLFARMVIQGGRHYFTIMESDGRWHSYPVDYTIGSKWQQAYATKLPDGQIHVFPIQYSAIEKKWLDYWKVIDAPRSERADPNTWERLDASTSYQVNCAVCHTSQLRQHCWRWALPGPTDFPRARHRLRNVPRPVSSTR